MGRLLDTFLRVCEGYSLLKHLVELLSAIGPDETPLSVTSEDSSSPPRRPPNPSPTNHSTLPARAPIPEFNFSPPPRLPSLPPPWQSQPTAPQRRQNALATSSAVASMSSTPAPSSSLAGSGHDLVQAALDKSRAHNRLADGVHRKYRRKEHIHAKLVKRALQLLLAPV